MWERANTQRGLLPREQAIMQGRIILISQGGLLLNAQGGGPLPSSEPCDYGSTCNSSYSS